MLKTDFRLYSSANALRINFANFDRPFIGISNDEEAPHVRCVHILIEGGEEKGALGRMAAEEMQTGKEWTLLMVTRSSGVNNFF